MRRQQIIPNTLDLKTLNNIDVMTVVSHVRPQCFSRPTSMLIFILIICSWTNFDGEFRRADSTSFFTSKKSEIKIPQSLSKNYKANFERYFGRASQINYACFDLSGVTRRVATNWEQRAF